MTSMHRRFGVAGLLACVSLQPLVFAAPVAAQEGETAESRDVITVTARRREESLQDVPLSVTAYSGDQLAAMGAADITAINETTPNVTLEVSRGTNSTLSAFIRGIGQQDPVAGFEAGVGIYLDDVYLNRPQGAVLDIYDVERVEVLRGPQGTLYGRNTIGGAVKYVTKRIDPDAPTFSSRINVGTYNQFDAIVSASAPLTDSFRVGGAIARLGRNGFGENLTTGQENYNKDVWAGRFTAEFEPGDDLFVRFSADRFEDGSNARGGHRLIDGALSGAPVLDDVFDTRGGLIGESEIEATGYSLLVEFPISDNWTARNILAYREDETISPIDFDALPSADLDVPVIYENDQFSEEFQLLYSGDRLNGVVGAYVLNANASNIFDVLLATTGALPAVGIPGLNAQTFGDVGTNTWSVFGDFTYDLTPEWSVSLGGRYTYDERESVVLRTTFAGGFSDTFGGAGVPIAATSTFDDSNDWTDFSPRLSVAYAPDDVNNYYFTFSQGFKGGGFDPRGQTSLAPDLNGDGVVTYEDVYEFMSFDPEEVSSYELGWKTQLGRYRHALAVFYSDYTNVQVPGSVGADANDDGIYETFTGVTTNAGSATIWGVEYEAFAQLAEDMFTSGDELTFNTSIGYLDGEYDEFFTIIGGVEVDISDEVAIQNTPDWTASGTLTYRAPLGNGDLSILSTVSYRGDSQQFERPAPIDQEAFTLWNASVLWDSEDGRWQFGVHGRNLTDEEYRVAGYDFVTYSPLGLEGTLTGFYGNPRTVTGTIAFRY